MAPRKEITRWRGQPLERLRLDAVDLGLGLRNFLSVPQA